MSNSTMNFNSNTQFPYTQQSPDLYVFHFPHDLERKIFQTAAVSDSRVALALSLVSREVRSWFVVV